MTDRLLGLALLVAVVVAISFLLYIGLPYRLEGDAGYWALSALQYVARETTTFYSVRLVNPHDLAGNVECPLAFWPPSYSALFVLVFRAGLAPGTAGRILAFVLSLIGAFGWLSVTNLLELRGLWRVAGVVLAALYCMRQGVTSYTASGDLLVYAVAPWLIGGAILLSGQLQFPLRPRLVGKMTLFCLALGAIAWLKYTALFLSAAIVGALFVEHFRSAVRSHLRSGLALAVICSAAFVLPILGLRSYSTSRNGFQVPQITVNSAPRRRLGVSTQRDVPGDIKFYSTNALYNASGILLSADQAASAIANRLHRPDWMTRLPGLLLLITVLYLSRHYPSFYVRSLAVWLVAIPTLGLPLLSFVTSLEFTNAMDRFCAPTWILLELLTLALLSQPAKEIGGQAAKVWLIGLTTIQLVLFLYIPFVAVRQAWRITHAPRYRASTAGLYVFNMSSSGTQEIDDEVHALIRGPEDVVVPVNYRLGMDTWLELRGRLLPLTSFSDPLLRTHGTSGANYYSTAPFYTSRPLRVILVASDPFRQPFFQAGIERVKRRFPQAGAWVMAPRDPDGRVEVWMADLQ